MCISKCFPDTTTLENLIAAESNHLTEFRIRPATRVSLRPVGGALADHPVAPADGFTSFGNQYFLSFFHDT